MVVGLYDTDGRYTTSTIWPTIVISNLLDPLARVDGVGDIQRVRQPVRHADLAGSRTSWPITS